MEESCRIRVRCWGCGLGLRRRSELAFDRLCAVGEPGLARGGSAAGGVSRRQVAAHSIRRAFGAVAPRHRDLRAHPPTDLAALVCRA
jgi:hypothetical protein